jgi:hypothetical protein
MLRNADSQISTSPAASGRMIQRTMGTLRHFPAA